MKAAVLCPGPSLSRCPPLDAGLVVGVNRAAAFRPCGVWAALDTPVIKTYGREVVGRPVLFTRRETAESLRRRGLLPESVVCCEDLACPVDRWDLFTLTAALVLAASRGATDVEVYGCDRTDGPDWDGVRAGENRGENRWERERRVWNELTAWLETAGVEVECCRATAP